MRFPHGLRALNHRDFRRFYAAQLLALVGGWMQTVAQAWLVLQLTDSPFKLGLISTLQFSPILMFSLVAGAVADRLPKRGLLVTTQTTLACQALLLGLPARERRATMLEEIVEGLRYARRTPRLLLALGLVLSVSLFVFNFTVYVPLLARTVLGLGAEGFGFLMASLGVGAVAGALTVGGFGSREPELGRMFLSAAVAFAALLGLGLSRHVWTAAPLLFVTGYFGIMLMATCNTSMQLRAPDALRGRVMSLYTWVTGGVFPIGAFLVGSISQAWGVSAAFLWNGTLGLVTLAGIMLWWRLRARAPRPA